MLSRVLVITMLICSAMSAYAQSPAPADSSLASNAPVQDKPTFSLGGGLNFNTIDGEEPGSGIDEEVSANLALAARVEIPLREQWSLRTGLWLQEKSAKYSVKTSGIEGDIKFNTIYASIPVTAKYQVNKMFGFFGGYIADIRINDYCSVDGDFDSCKLKDDSKSVVHLATLGASIWATDLFSFEASYQRALSDMQDDSKIHTFQVMAFFHL